MNLDDIKQRLLSRVNLRNIDSINLVIRVLDYVSVCPHWTIIAEYLDIDVDLLHFKLNYYLTPEEREFVFKYVSRLKQQERERYFRVMDAL